MTTKTEAGLDFLEASAPEAYRRILDLEAAVPGVPRVLGPFVFNFDDAGLNDGIAFYTPTVGDVLLDAWIFVQEAFDGTTPKADIGTFVDVSTGLFYSATNSGILSISNAVVETAGTGTSIPSGSGAGGYGWMLSAIQGGSGAGGAPAKFTAANPLKFVASQDGAAGGTAVGGTAGIAHVYIIVATPYLP